jgi:DNA-binding Lrp family transcriptional regulator
MLEDALEYIKSHEEGVLQSELWKALGIDSRKCSRLVARLLKENLIRRERESVDGVRTYRLVYDVMPKENRFQSLIAGEIFEPCAGCIAECVPEQCMELSEWILNLVICESSDIDYDILVKNVGTAKLRP